MQINNHNEIQLYTYKDGYYLKKERKEITIVGVDMKTLEVIFGHC